MNAPAPLARESLASLLARAREPFPASRKQYLAGAVHADLRVPVRDIALTNGEQVSVYDTSGPYTDPQACFLFCWCCHVRPSYRTCSRLPIFSALRWWCTSIYPYWFGFWPLAARCGR